MEALVNTARCICGCQQLTKEEIADILMGNIERFLSNTNIVQVFRKFIDPDSITQEYLDVVSLATKLSNADEIDDEEEESLQEIISMDFCRKLNERGADKRQIFANIKDDYSKKVEDSEDYERFRDYLRKKYASAGSIKKCT